MCDRIAPNADWQPWADGAAEGQAEEAGEQAHEKGEAAMTVAV